MIDQDQESLKTVFSCNFQEIDETKVKLQQKTKTKIETKTRNKKKIFKTKEKINSFDKFLRQKIDHEIPLIDLFLVEDVIKGLKPNKKGHDVNLFDFNSESLYKEEESDDDKKEFNQENLLTIKNELENFIGRMTSNNIEFN